MQPGSWNMALAMASAGLPFLVDGYVNYGYMETDTYNRLNEQLKICYPKPSKGDPIVPPCISINEMEMECHPNGTDKLDFLRHAQCVCEGSFFQDWFGCQNCLYAHGLRSERDLNYWSNVAEVVSTELCTGTPTADFPVLFNSVIKDPSRVPYPTTGATDSSDYWPSLTAVSLYYTPTVTQGPASITVPLPTPTHRSYGYSR